MTHKDILTPINPSLGFGAMRLPDEKETLKMVDAYMDSGYNYFDTAYAYGGSEEMLKKTLVKRYPRDSFMITSKLPPWNMKKPEDASGLLKESLIRSGLDYFDFYVMHSLSDSSEKHYEDMGIFEWAFEQKKRGLVKHVGFSFHGTTAYLERLLTRHAATEFVMLQLNYIDILRGPARQWQELAIKHNKPIIAMEPIKGGTLAHLPDSAEKLLKAYDPNRSIASWAMQYAASLEGVSCVLSGMSNLAQMQDNIKTAKNLKPLTEKEYDLLEKVLIETGKKANIACTACKYCHEHCPQGIDIAACFTHYNEIKRGSAHWNVSMLYDVMPENNKASNCTKCGACLPYCPQSLDIPAGLSLVSKELE